MEQTSVVEERCLRQKVSVPNTLGLNGRLTEALELGLRGRSETTEAIQKFGEEMADVAHLRARLPLIIALAIVERVRYPVVYEIPTSDLSLEFCSGQIINSKSEGFFGKTLEMFNLIRGESIKGYPLPVIVCAGNPAYISIDIAEILANVG